LVEVDFQMIGTVLHSLWNFLFGWAGIDMLIGFAAVAVAVLTPPAVVAFIPDLRKWAIGAAVVAFTLMGAIAHGYKNGLDEKQRQWDAALAREQVNGEKARSDALATIGPVPADRSMFDNDPDNRDRGKHAGERKGPVRWLGQNSLFGR
jgi:hypothetical protein